MLEIFSSSLLCSELFFSFGQHIVNNVSDMQSTDSPYFFGSLFIRFMIVCISTFMSSGQCVGVITEAVGFEITIFSYQMFVE